jgi:hypothetical protein
MTIWAGAEEGIWKGTFGIEGRRPLISTTELVTSSKK